MDAQLPLDIQRCFELGASRLGEDLVFLEWPNGGKDGAPAERNAMFNVAYYLGSLPKRYHLYFEGTAGNGRMDMMGCDGETAIAIEAKSLGDINRQSASLLTDLDRLLKFSPFLTEKLNDNSKPHQWWQEATNRWGILLILSFRGREIADAWKTDDTNLFREKMESYIKRRRRNTDSNGEISKFLALSQAIPLSGRGAALIIDGKHWQDCGEGWLLWGAIPLPNVRADANSDVGYIKSPGGFARA